MTTTDVIVVGLGAMGSATLYQLARRRVRVLGLDRFGPPHDRGSSHGESRITRQAIGEGEEYVPFALRSHEIWRDLEAETGGALLFPVGGLLIGRERGTAQHHGQSDFIGRTIAAARRYGIAHEVLGAAEVAERFPQFRLVGDEVAYYEPGAGFLRPERCVATQLYRARALGATMRTGETVVRVTPGADSVEVVTDRATYAAGRVVVTAGAWLPALVGGPFPKLLGVYRQVMHWFAADDAAAFAPGRFPIFIWMHGAGASDYFYGFPRVADGVKIASEQFAESTEPDRVDRRVAAAEPAATHAAHIQGRMAGVSRRCLRSETCLYTVTPGSRFLIDRHPDGDRVIVASPCSGHGFKHSAAIGEAIAELVTEGRSRLDLVPFSLARVTGTAPAS
ncbi:MAG: N-methyl-L-tryptophan oxidase [Candidatus Rokubacteria bacterium]|nr:N-methyl-L-tryptophan oxidase [Candidatus Rokubacteria bacterium]